LVLPLIPLLPLSAATAAAIAATAAAESREVTDYSWKESGGPAASAEDRLVAEMGPFENYIMGMLTNFGSLPCERLHNMLRVFVVGEPKYEGRSQEQLGAFLQLLVDQGKLEVNTGMYSRSKGTS
jgi:anaphase-promoting complex subunit 2